MSCDVWQSSKYILRRQRIIQRDEFARESIVNEYRGRVPWIKTNRKRKWIGQGNVTKRYGGVGVGNKPQIIVLWIFRTGRENNVGCGRSIGISFLPPSLCRRFKLALCKFTPSAILLIRASILSTTNACTRTIFNGREWTRTNEQWCRVVFLSFYPSFCVGKVWATLKRSEEKWWVTISSLSLSFPLSLVTHRTAEKTPVRYIRRKSKNLSRFFLEFTRYTPRMKLPKSIANFSLTANDKFAFCKRFHRENLLCTTNSCIHIS